MDGPVYAQAREAYRALSALLGDQDFFFGSEPTSLDCIVFGHLALHFYPSLSNTSLKTILMMHCPNLVRFMHRFRYRYLGGTVSPDKVDPTRPILAYSQTVWSQKAPMEAQTWSDYFESVKQQFVKASGGKTSNTIVKQGAWVIPWDRILTVSGGLGALVLFAWRRGIVSFSSDDDEYAYMDDQDSPNDNEEDEE